MHNYYIYFIIKQLDLTLEMIKSINKVLIIKLSYYHSIKQCPSVLSSDPAWTQETDAVR